MIGTDLDHWRVVMESLSQGEESLEADAQASLHVLSERLQQLKKRYPQLAKVAFSSALEHARTPASALSMH